jgi:uridine kinase
MSGSEQLDEIPDAVRARAGDVAVGIDGHSAAGKSTLAGRLAAELDAVLVHGDDFYRVMDPGERAALSPEEGAHRYYDWERLRADVLEPLRDGRDAAFQRYDWDRNELAEVMRVGPAKRVVVEGLFVTRPELLDLVDVTVVVEAPADVRERRQAERGDSTSWLGSWDAAERWFFEHVRRPDAFDFRVGGS